MMLELRLNRKVLATAFTLGSMVFAGLQYYSVEDTVRPLSHCTQTTCAGKVGGKTAIPAGRYEVKDTYSPRFRRNVLTLVGVPGFQGIRIHSGNDADDTEGCIILGFRETEVGVAQSKAAMRQFNTDVRKELAKGTRVFLTIQ